MAEVTTRIAKVQPQHRGEWSADTAYTLLNIVTHGGGSYMCIADNTGAELADETHWKPLAAKGDKGDQGDQGIPGGNITEAAQLPTSDGSNVQAKLTEHASQLAEIGAYNIKNYGAVGDGTTVNTTAIQAALNAANVSGGGTVFVPDGVFLTDSLVVYSNTSIVGRSRWKSIVKLVDAPSGALFNCSGTSGAQKSNISFDNLRLQHTFSFTADSTTKGVLIYGKHTGNSQVKNCIFDNYKYTGVWIETCGGSLAYPNWQIQGNRFFGVDTTSNNPTYGVRMAANGEYNDISGNYFSTVYYPIYLENSANNHIVNNTICWGGIGISYNSYTLATNSGKLLIANNTINHVADTAIRVQLQTDASYPVSYQNGCVINGNIIMLPATKGIYLRGGYGHCVTGNRVMGLTGATKYLHMEDYDSYPLDYCMVKDNVFQQGALDNTATGTHNDVTSNMVIP